MAEFTATSGSYTTTLTVNQTSQDVASNTSVLTYSLTLKKNSGYGLWNNNSCPWSITINGTTVSGTFTYDFRNYSSLTLKGNTTISVPHNSDGTKSVSVSASVNMDNTPYVYTMSPSGTLTLTTIPRASTPSVANSYSIANTTGSLSYSITSQANFYHIVYWGIGDWVDEVRVGNINTTTKSFTIANTSLLAKMSTTTSATLTITVSTYSDSAYNSFVASSTVYSTITVNTSYIKPSVSLGNIVINSTPITGYAVAGYASLRDTFSTTNSSGANGVTTYFSISTGSLQTTSTTSTSGTIYTNTVPQSNSNYTLTIYAYAKDSRGATSDTVSKSITVYGYQPPTANLTAYRTTSSSSTNEDGAGIYAYVTFSGAVRSTVNNQNSIQSVACTYSGSISGTATSGGHYALADNQSVTFTLTVTDKVTSSTAVVNITSAIYPLDLVDDGNGHVGGGFATLAEINKFKFGLPVEVNGAVTATQFNGNSTGTTLNRTSSNPDSALKQNSVVFGEYYDGNIPTGQGYWHIVSLQGPDVRWGTQIAIGQTVQGVFYRRFANNSWTSWIQIG